MSRFFIPQQNISKDEVIINDPLQVHHLKDVLRKKAQDKIEVFDGNNVFECVIKSIDKKRIVAQIENRETVQLKDVHTTLACAIPKKTKFDTIVEKTTELGVDSIVPLITQRTIVRFKAEEVNRKLARWHRIAQEAAKQSGRLNLPVIEAPTRFNMLAKRFSHFDYLLMPNLFSKKRLSILKAFEGIKGKQKILLLIGPEGDFTPEEIDMAKAHKALEVSLGDTVLKVETAAIICVGSLSLIATC